MPHSLASYVRAIKQQPAAVSLVSQCAEQRFHEESDVRAGAQAGAVDREEVKAWIEETTTLYQFSNGVQIRCVEEQDRTIEPAAEQELCCPEVWISYEVIESAGLEIRPAQKVFHNACQAAFWLKMQSRP